MSHVFVNVLSLLLYSFSRILDSCGSREIDLLLLKTFLIPDLKSSMTLTIFIFSGNIPV